MSRETSRKWRAVADPTAAVPNRFVTQGTCRHCGQLCCNCVHCVAFKGADTCDVCRREGA